MDNKLSREQKGGLLVWVLFFVLLLAFTFPVYSIANRVDPFVMGMPFSLFWIVAWVGFEFIVLLLAYIWEYRKGVH